MKQCPNSYWAISQTAEKEKPELGKICRMNLNIEDIVKEEENEDDAKVRRSRTVWKRSLLTSDKV